MRNSRVCVVTALRPLVNCAVRKIGIEKTFPPACAVQDCTGQNGRVWGNNVYSVSSPSAFDEDTSANPKFLGDWKQIYERESCLWQVKCKEYHGRVKKDADYARLLVILKEVDTNTTRYAIIKKINNLRSGV
ncbi:hypothetical protein PR048_021808 [Dryococelus australis]|uniref:MADF domain-containing protein n=1 Tax=Dryococelus australis TaxID=614101 RepID=A0ABQ9GZ74_9NEOP|nr:hypothetical protein PR048_021808 [Dryococelus australis]